ncbi:MAG: nitrogenase cofactor biosynthesis protein NifB [Verrucomicrobiales bacterium]|jgi:nitrogen fixation protein NifB|nr:nitrogenase cofactor biosynthesis protein NifB [Verrucomicrobiales bacterium]
MNDSVEEATPVAAVDLSRHPCFNREAHQRYGRLHLPVAPRCNLQCNFCNRKFDCMNESRPGVTSTVLKPEQAAAYLHEIVTERPEITVVGIAGPGDPFANGTETMETLRLVRRQHPEIILCLASNGLGIASYIPELAELRVSHVTLTINAVDPAVAAKIYPWIRNGKQPLRGLAAAELLLERQWEALRLLKQHGIIAKINSIIIPGVNDEHIPEVARRAAQLGADIMNCIPMIPVSGAFFEDLPAPDNLMTSRVRLTCGQHLPQMAHCARCRADAVGLLNEKMTDRHLERLNRFAQGALLKGRERPYIAVASQEGMLVNQHLGEAARLLIFRQSADTESGFKFVEMRPAPEPGTGSHRWHELAAVLHDCRAFLVNAAGPAPKSALGEHGIEVVEMEGLIEEGLRAVFNGQSIPASLKRRFTGCGSGSSCRGSGTGCA